MGDETSELPSQVWLLTNGRMIAFHRLGLQMPRWAGRIVDRLPDLLADETSRRIAFYWAEVPNWRQPTPYLRVVEFLRAIQPTQPADETEETDGRHRE